ncbi:MAG: hypothetical protein HY288_03940 [Planctomycetia bacterium]|nr:hypothetical protein [Planctomycetia bacterium]
MAILTSEEKRTGKNRNSVVVGPAGPWHKRAPRQVRQSYESPADEQNWAAWCRHLAKRKFCPVGSLLPGKRSALTWALPEGLEEVLHPSGVLGLGATEGSTISAGSAGGQAARSTREAGSAVPLDQTLELIETLRKLDESARRKVTALENDVACRLARVASTPASAALGLECLAWCGALPRLTAHLPSRPWWQLVNRLISIASNEGPTADDVLAMQLLGGELPLALAYSFPEIETCQELADEGRRTISRSIDELLDGEGLPHGRHLHLLRPLLACWTRSQAIGHELSQGWCDRETQRQYAGLVEHALRLSRTNGQQVFSRADSKPWDSNLLKTALSFADDRATERVFRLVENGRQALRKIRGKTLPSPAFQDEWAGLAMLRPDWSRKAPRLTVSYGGQRVATELSVDSRCLWSGIWKLDVRFNGRPLERVANWEQTCWVSDDEVDYLELEMRLSEEVTVQRHMLLGRNDRFVFLADAVLGIQQGTIEYRGTLPSSGHSSFDPERETREGSLLVGPRPRARVLPLALNEWRTGASRGNLQASHDGLELTQGAEGQCLFAPLFIDLDASRLNKEVTWRQLTVAQQREITPSDVAVGYRAQVGKSQWLVYRSLATPDIRTVLGKNLMTEFLVGHFQTDGHVKTLLEIE